MPGEAGNRNTLRGPGFAGLDLGLSKRWKMPWGESHNLVFRWEVFNVVNWVNLNAPTTALNNANFGKILSAGDPRIMQLALKFSF